MPFASISICQLRLVQCTIFFPTDFMETRSVQSYAAEMLSTFVLTFAVSASLLFDVPVPTPVVAALVVAVFVYTIGGISGAHINPAVTIGMWSIKQIDTKHALAYIASQIIGAGLASLSMMSMTAVAPLTMGQESVAIIVAEAVGAFLLVFGITAVVTGKAEDDASGLIIGGSLLMGILVASFGSAGILNPAVAFGLGAVSVCYVLGPIIGGVLGALCYRWISS